MMMPHEFTVEEKQAVEKLKQRTKDEHTPQILRDETIFYRFLKARNFNLKNAETMLRRHFQDRKLYGLDDILQRYTPSEKMKLYMPATFLGFDKEGSAIVYIDVGGADIQGVVNLCDFKEFVLFVSHFISTDMERMTENSLQTGRHAYQYFIIINMDKLNLFHATYKKGIEYLFNGLILYQRNFPERLKEVHIINSSYTFSIFFQLMKSALADILYKLHMYGSSGWQEVLQDKIDLTDLPAFLGGKRTDPDGNPRCNSFINHGRKIPVHLYDQKCKSKLKWEEGIQKLTVARSTSSDIRIRVDEQNTSLKWEYELEWGDIQFSLCFKENYSDELEELIPKKKITSEMNLQTGTHTCDKAGIYIFIFDNTNSWMYSKEVHCKIQTIKPQVKTL